MAVYIVCASPVSSLSCVFSDRQEAPQEAPPVRTLVFHAGEGIMGLIRAIAMPPTVRESAPSWELLEEA